MKDPKECNTIEDIRYAIDTIDQQIMKLFGQRFDYVKEIVRFKSSEEEIIAQKRFDEVIARRKELAIQNGLDPEVIAQMYKLLINYFISEEMKLLKVKKG